MVNRKQFEEICNKYGLDSKKLIKNNQELLEKFSNDRLKVILQYYLDENSKKREILKKISN